MKLAFHHVGVVTADLDASVALYRALGYQASELFDDPLQQVRIVLCTRDDGPMIELITPATPSSPAAGWLKRIKAGPYHTCYRVADLEASIEGLRELGFLPLSQAVPAVAFGGRRVIFLFSAAAGLLELVEDQPPRNSPA